MKVWNFFLPLALVLLSGCQSKDELPEVRPLPDNKVKVALEISVNDRGRAQDKTRPNRIQLPPPEQPERKNPAAAPENPLAKKKISIPAPERSAAIDADLNSVERSYVQQIRKRHQKAAADNEEKVFGSFKPQNVIKGK